MPEDKPEEQVKAPAKERVKTAIPVPRVFKVVKKQSKPLSITIPPLRVRVIQQSFLTNPKMVEKARKSARELKEKRESAVGKSKTASYTKKSLSLFPVK